MPQRNFAWLLTIVLIVISATYIVVSGVIPAVGSWPGETYTLHQGLDLRGGLQVLLEADVPAGTSVDRTAMSTAKQIVERRVNGLGVAEPLVQQQGDRRIVVELPEITNPQQAIDLLKQTGLLEFVSTGFETPAAGATIATDCTDPSRVDCGTSPAAAPTPAPATAAAGEATPTTAPAAEATPTAEAPSRVYHTVMTGVGLADAVVDRDTLGRWVINFTLKDDASKIFSDFTTAHVSETLAIVLDKTVISAPNINEPITGGRGSISGNFTSDSANQLALQLRYGSLPVPLKVVQSREVGPTLGQDSVRRSAVAGIVGLTTVALFMLLYYRLPGAIADIALLIYAVITLALFKLIPVTLTLPGIAGFVLSVGVAVDANILIFERMKEELRAGRNLRNAVDAGFTRAWSSIRDSNVSTLITCAILYIFGNAFGASIVKGFALTLALGVGVSLFTAILVTRSILHAFLDRIDFSSKHSWFGI